jgi:hypothetical protein
MNHWSWMFGIWYEDGQPPTWLHSISVLKSAVWTYITIFICYSLVLGWNSECNIRRFGSVNKAVCCRIFKHGHNTNSSKETDDVSVFVMCLNQRWMWRKAKLQSKMYHMTVGSTWLPPHSVSIMLQLAVHGFYFKVCLLKAV